MYIIPCLIILLSLLFPLTHTLVNPNDYVDHVQKIIQKSVVKFQNERFDIDNGQCVVQLKQFLTNLQNSTFDDVWALKMIDASVKIPSGLMEYNFAWVGDYEECLDIDSTFSDVKGKYCLISISLDRTKTKPSPNLPSIGICIPNKCTSSDVDSFLAPLFESFTRKTYCQTKEDRYPVLNTKTVLTGTFFGFFICLMIASSIYDVIVQRNNKSRPHPLLSACSVYTNAPKLFRNSKNSDELSCLNGIRVLSMFWVILAHIFYLTVKGPVTNYARISRFVTNWKSLIFANAPFSVDSFFVVTGMLIVYNFQKSHLKGQKFSFFQFYLHRFIRLTPPIIPVLLVCMYLNGFMGTGPYHPELDEQIGQTCRRNWWTVLLHIQNYLYDFDDMCLSHTWYVDVDWQLYLLAPSFLLFLPNKAKIGIGILVSGLTGSIIAPLWLTIDKNLPSSNFNGNIDEYAKYYYFKTHNRAAPWIIGALLGYILSKVKLEKQITSLKLPKTLVSLMWILALTITSTCVFGAYKTQTDTHYHKYGNAFFNSLARPAWAVSLAWIIFASSLGYGGLVNSILSWPIFQILNKFSYSIYLVHLPMLFVITYSQVLPRHFSLFTMLYSFPQVLAAGFVISIFWTLAFEVPVIGIERYLRQSKQNSKEQE